MNTNNLLTILGLVSGVSELVARSGILGDRTVIADGIFSISLAVIGFLAQGRSPATEG